MPLFILFSICAIYSTLSAEEVEKLAQLQKMWALRKPILDAHILSLQENMQKLELEIDGIVMEKLKGGVSNPRPR